ncbi:HNH endonuclease [Streptomyces sp. NBC_00286]|uniref:HNH endonuclease n=1 Tax=Streptomyces sp. NBC_00286 TaxID=2975701 RepID=UPI002E2DAAA1|nr:HNH endonuclease [Streptomyces sp. NBC_00286]
MALTDITRIEVNKAVEQYDRLGRDAFLQQYGFGHARRYMLLHGDRHYDSKAIVGAAHGFVPGQEPLAAKDFSGGAGHAVRLLRRLGFTVVDELVETVDIRDDLIERVVRLKVNRSSGRPALFQPIVLLWAIGRARRGEPRLLSWRETEEALTTLLQRHGMRGERPRPDYPVAALCRAGLWVLPDHQGAVPAAHGDTELRNWFRDNQPLGGLAESVYDLLRRSGETRLAVIGELLCRFFDDLDYGPLLTDVGLYDDDVASDATPSEAKEAENQPEPWLITAAEYERLCRIAEHGEGKNHGKRVSRTARNPIRSSAARWAALGRSKGRCENPHCAGQPADVTDKGLPILEVDHVMDLALGGRDHPSQMVALCPNCHAVKTRGRTREALRETLLKVAVERHNAVQATRDSSVT